jgi:hypothetical protein
VPLPARCVRSPFLQRLDLEGNRCLTEIEMFRNSAKTQMFGHRPERLQPDVQHGSSVVFTK